VQAAELPSRKLTPFSGICYISIFNVYGQTNVANCYVTRSSRPSWTRGDKNVTFQELGGLPNFVEAHRTNTFTLG
jgi:hypothetical protein